MAAAEFEDIVEDFAFLEDWEDRYRHVIDLGKAMDPLPEDLRVPATKVEGCASQVWLVPEITGSGPDAVVAFRGESDAMIVRGLIAVLIALCSGRDRAAPLPIAADHGGEKHPHRSFGHLVTQVKRFVFQIGFNTIATLFAA